MGYGGAVVEAAKEFARRTGMMVALDAKAFDDAPMTVTELRDFYLRHGFKVVKANPDRIRMVYSPNKETENA